MRNKLAHIKLSNNEELICEVIKNNIFGNKMMVKSALTFIKKIHPEGGYPYYSFMPFMVQKSGLYDVIEINKSQIISKTEPSKLMAESYKKYAEHEIAASKIRDQYAEEVINKLRDDSDANKSELEKYDFSNQKLQ